MPRLNKYEIGVKHESGRVYYTGYTLLAVCKDDAIAEYFERSGDNVDKKQLVVNLLE